jgi:hypothetical protein
MKVSEMIRQAAQEKVEFVKVNELKKGDIVFPRYLSSGTKEPAEIMGPPKQEMDPLLGFKVFRFPAKAGNKTGLISLGPSGGIHRKK